jgi:hypothetical protein
MLIHSPRQRKKIQIFTVVNEVDWLVVALMQFSLDVGLSQPRADWMDRPVTFDPDDEEVDDPTQKKSGKSPSCSTTLDPERSFKS